MAGNDTKSTLLCHWNGPDGGKEIVDDGNTGHIISLVSGAQTSTTQKAIGNCSLYLNGSSDYITAPDSDDWMLDGGSGGDFTVEFRWRPTVVTNYIWGLAEQYQDGSNYWNIGLNYGSTSDNKLTFYYRSGAAYKAVFNSDATGIAANTWSSIAIVRSSSSILFFVDGVSKGSNQTVALSNFGNIASTLRIGYSEQQGTYNGGYFDEYRISNVARYKANYTVSTIALTSDANTKLLLHMESHDTALGGSYLPATFVGTAQLDTAVKTFGTASLLLDGDSDWVTFPDSTLWDFTNEPFTVDCRIKKNADGINEVIVGQYGASIAQSAWLLFITTANKLQCHVYVGTTDYALTASSTSLIVADGWYHIALIRNGNTITQYINGTADGTLDATGLTLNSSDDKIYVGTLDTAPNFPFNGYIDELRVSKGIARWTANFTPPSAEYSEDAPAPAGSGRRIFLIT